MAVLFDEAESSLNFPPRQMDLCDPHGDFESHTPHRLVKSKSVSCSKPAPTTYSSGPSRPSGAGAHKSCVLTERVYRGVVRSHRVSRSRENEKLGQPPEIGPAAALGERCIESRAGALNSEVVSCTLPAVLGTKLKIPAYVLVSEVGP